LGYGLGLGGGRGRDILGLVRRGEIRFLCVVVDVGGGLMWCVASELLFFGGFEVGFGVGSSEFSEAGEFFRAWWMRERERAHC